jgi:type IV secretory pathway protease TraF
MRTPSRRLRLRGGAIAILALTLIGVVLALAGAANAPRLVWNFTSSIPVGLYSIEERDWQVEDRVALEPSGRLLEMLQTAGVLKDGRLLMKRVAASGGDEVCRSGEQVVINGVPRAVARPDEVLPHWSGCRRLSAGQVFLLGETDNSFDGRYFGVTAAGDIIGPLRALLVF